MIIAMKNIWKDAVQQLCQLRQTHPQLTLGMMISSMVLLVFLILQQLNARLLMLELQWLVVALLPTLVALFAGGYLACCRKFGADLNGILKTPVGNILPPTTHAAVPSGETVDLTALEKLAGQSPQRLVLTANKSQDAYVVEIVQAYLERIHSVQYLEIQTASPAPRFISLLPKTAFFSAGKIQTATIERLVAMLPDLKTDQLRAVFSTAMVSTLPESTSLIESLKLMRLMKLSQIAVVNSQQMLEGVLDIRGLELRIIDGVVDSAPEQIK